MVEIHLTCGHDHPKRARSNTRAGDFHFGAEKLPNQEYWFKTRRLLSECGNVRIENNIDSRFQGRGRFQCRNQRVNEEPRASATRIQKQLMLKSKMKVKSQLLWGSTP